MGPVSHHCRRFCFCSSVMFTMTDPSLITKCMWQFCMIMLAMLPWFHAMYDLFQRNILNSDMKAWIYFYRFGVEFSERLMWIRLRTFGFYITRECFWRNESTRVGTLIVATIYLQLIQNRYMFRSFTVLQCSHQHCLQPVSSDVEVVGYL